MEQDQAERNVLLGVDSLDPANREIALIEADAERAAGELSRWLRTSAAKGGRIDVRRVDGPLADVVQQLWPLTAPLTLRFELLETDSPWSCYLDNGIDGPDAANLASQLALRLNCRAMRLAAVPDRVAGGERLSYGANMFELYGPEGLIRAVAVVNDGGRWVFDAGGDPLPFEETSRYDARIVRQRFTTEHLRELTSHFGLRPFDRDFFEPRSRASAILIERFGMKVTREVKWRR